MQCIEFELLDLGLLLQFRRITEGGDTHVSGWHMQNGPEPRAAWGIQIKQDARHLWIGQRSLRNDGNARLRKRPGLLDPGMGKAISR